MTDKEINRKFDAVANHLVTLAVGLQQLQESQARTEQTVNRLAEKVDRLAEKVDRTAGRITNLLAAAEIQAGEISQLADAIRAVDERERETRENLNALINTVERFISEGRNGKGGEG